MIKTNFDAPPTPAAPPADRVVIPIAQALPEPHSAPRGPRTCEELGICQGRYPACGRCDDNHSADEPPTPTPFDQIYAWGISATIAAAVVAAAGVLALAAGATVNAVARLLS